MSDSVDGGCTSQISVGKFKLQNIDLNNYLKVEDSGNGMRVAGGSRPDPPGTYCFIWCFEIKIETKPRSSLSFHDFQLLLKPNINLALKSKFTQC